MKKYTLLLPIFILIISLLWGTSLPFGKTMAVESGPLDIDILTAQSGIGTAFNRITSLKNNSEFPVVQQQELPLQDPLPLHNRYLSDEQENKPLETVESKEPEKENGETANTKKYPESEKVAETIAPPQKKTPTPESNSQPKTNEKKTVRVTANSLNVRTGPSVEYELSDSLNLGQTVEVVAEDNDWLQIKRPNGQTGWIASWYTTDASQDSGNSKGSLAGKIIAIDPGHGGSDPGAVGVSGLREKDVVLDVSLRVAEKLRADGAKVILTRDTDVFIPLSGRVNIAEAAGAHVYISVHANAHPNPQIGGIETYYFRNKANSDASFTLASHLQKELVSKLGLRDIGVKDGNFLVIRQTSMPSVLLELGFLSFAPEEELMRTDNFRKSSADAIVNGIHNYFR